MSSEVDVIESVQDAVLCCESAPVRLVLGVGIWHSITAFVTSQAWNVYDADTDEYRFMGVPVELDFDDPGRIEVQSEWNRYEQ